MMDTSRLLEFRETKRKSMKKQNNKNKEVKKVTTKFYFFNQGKSYTMLVTAPETVPQYRLKEIFDKNFVGKGTSINFDPTIFSKYDGTYIIV